jgi:hypothetical protein
MFPAVAELSLFRVKFRLKGRGLFREQKKPRPQGAGAFFDVRIGRLAQ